MFFDFARAKDIWRNVETVEELFPDGYDEPEFYWDWMKGYAKDKDAALAALKTHPRREEIEAIFDRYLTYDHWVDQVFYAWLKRFEMRVAQWPTFEQLRAWRNRPDAECVFPQTSEQQQIRYRYGLAVDAKWIYPEPSLPEAGKPFAWKKLCGYLPDWRDAEDRKAEQKLLRYKTFRKNRELWLRGFFHRSNRQYLPEDFGIPRKRD